MTTAIQIREFIRDTFFAEGFADDESFLKSGTIDSSGMLELISFVEAHFGLKIDDTELLPENLDSIANLVAFIDNKRSIALAS